MDGTVGQRWLELAARWAQEPEWVEAWGAISALGGASAWALLMPLALALLPRHHALRLVAYFAGAAWVVEWLKAATLRARPDPVAFGLPGPLEDPGAYLNSAFPSGHVFLATVVWGMVALRSGRRAVALPLAGAFVLLMGASRVALLRHDLLDVGGGLLLGALWLGVLHAVDRALLPSWSRLPWVERAGLWLLAGATLGLLAPNPTGVLLAGVLAGAGAGATAGASWRARRTRPGWTLALPRVLLAVATIAACEAWAPPGARAATTTFAAWLVAGLLAGGLLPAWLGGVWVGPGAERV